jgi:SAM-dependent methyltransferase
VQTYTEDFFKWIEDGSTKSAKEIIPIIFEFIQPKSVIDVGCGTGTWLSVFQEHGVEEIWGVDGDYVDQKNLEIPQDRFLSFDLKNPLSLDRQFDLVVSLEVAEHLPSDCAETFVDSLTRLGSVILFSAAIPFQGGTEHINEQWLDYWANYFQKKGYVAIDCIRPRIWENDNVEMWYAQNILIFAQKDSLKLPQYYLLKNQFELTRENQLSIVHPKIYLEKYIAEKKAAQWYAAEAEKYLAASDPKNMSFKRVLSALPIIFKNTLQRKLFNNNNHT